MSAGQCTKLRLCLGDSNLNVNVPGFSSTDAPWLWICTERWSMWLHALSDWLSS